ncbi:hypothetical protein [Cylindrospermopsis raciborskii]|uniref:hypothetical protein n=1 Tax=Cylindrospermopsis raciborskii TaxID=77022 RepID=UPI001427D88A|nr:hypothetical protein [Cylindrospermopsis raciborskii]
MSRLTDKNYRAQYRPLLGSEISLEKEGETNERRLRSAIALYWVQKFPLRRLGRLMNGDYPKQ